MVQHSLYYITNGQCFTQGLRVVIFVVNRPKFEKHCCLIYTELKCHLFTDTFLGLTNHIPDSEEYSCRLCMHGSNKIYAMQALNV